MTNSTGLLTSAQAAARLGVKRATLYAYVSRGLLTSHPSPDGRRSLFDPADIARLERRGGTRHGAPSDVVVGSELALVDPAARSLWYRGFDALEASRRHSFESICALLWTGNLNGSMSWRPEASTWRVAKKAVAGLPRGTPSVERLSTCATSVAASHSLHEPPTALLAGADLMACLVEAVPGPDTDHASFAVRLWTKLSGIEPASGWSSALSATLSLLCAPRLTHASLAARMAASNGTGLASSVAAAMLAAEVPVRAYAAIETALRAAAEDGVLRAADALDRASIGEAFSRDPYRSGDPRTPFLLSLIAEAAPVEAETARELAAELQRRGADHPTASYAAATLSWAGGMPPGSGAVIARLANVAGWIAHVLEEYRLPTPYRPRLSYTGRPPRSSIPRRSLDAVQDYLSGT